MFKLGFKNSILILFIISTLLKIVFSYTALCANEKCSEPIALGVAVQRFPPNKEFFVTLQGNEKVKILSKQKGTNYNKNLLVIENNGSSGFAYARYIKETKILVKPEFLIEINLPEPQDKSESKNQKIVQNEVKESIENTLSRNYNSDVILNASVQTSNYDIMPSQTESEDVVVTSDIEKPQMTVIDGTQFEMTDIDLTPSTTASPMIEQMTQPYSQPIASVSSSTSYFNKDSGPSIKIESDDHGKTKEAGGVKDEVHEPIQSSKVVENLDLKTEKKDEEHDDIVNEPVDENQEIEDSQPTGIGGLFKSAGEYVANLLSPDEENDSNEKVPEQPTPKNENLGVESDEFLPNEMENFNRPDSANVVTKLEEETKSESEITPEDPIMRNISISDQLSSDSLDSRKGEETKIDSAIGSTSTWQGRKLNSETLMKSDDEIELPALSPDISSDRTEIDQGKSGLGNGNQKSTSLTEESNQSPLVDKEQEIGEISEAAKQELNKDKEESLVEVKQETLTNERESVLNETPETVSGKENQTEDKSMGEKQKLEVDKEESVPNKLPETIIDTSVPVIDKSPVTNEPESVADKKDLLVNNPDSLASKPESVTEKPEALVHKIDAGETEPIASDSEPPADKKEIPSDETVSPAFIPKSPVVKSLHPAEKTESPVDDIQPSSGKIESSADKKEPSADKIETSADKIEPSADKIEPLANKREPSTDKIEASADKIDPSSDKIGPSSDKIGPSSDEIEPSADKSETSDDQMESPADKIETSADKAESLSDDTKPKTDNTEQESLGNKYEPVIENQDSTTSEKEFVDGTANISVKDQEHVNQKKTLNEDQQSLPEEEVPNVKQESLDVEKDASDDSKEQSVDGNVIKEQLLDSAAPHQEEDVKIQDLKSHESVSLADSQKDTTEEGIKLDDSTLKENFDNSVNPEKIIKEEYNAKQEALHENKLPFENTGNVIPSMESLSSTESTTYEVPEPPYSNYEEYIRKQDLSGNTKSPDIVDNLMEESTDFDKNDFSSLNSAIEEEMKRKERDTNKNIEKPAVPLAEALVSPTSESFSDSSVQTEHAEDIPKVLRGYVQSALEFVPDPLHSSLLDLKTRGLSPGATFLTCTVGFLLILLISFVLIIKRSNKEGYLLDMLCKLEEKIFKLGTENKIVKEELEKAKYELADLSSHGLRTKDYIDALQQELNQSKNQNSAFKNAVEKLQAQLDGQRETIVTLQSKGDEYSEENQILQSKLLDAERSSLESAKRIEKLEDELKEMSNSLLSTEDSERELQSKVIQLEQEKEQLLQEAVIWNQRVQELRTQLESYHSSQEEFKDALDAKQKEIDVINEAIKKVEEVDEEKRTGLSSEQYQELVNSLVDVSKVSLDLKSMKEERDMLVSQLDCEKEKGWLLENKITEIENQMADARESCKAAQRDKTEAKNKLEVLTNYFKEKEAQLQKELGAQEVMRQQKETDADTSGRRLVSLIQENETLKSQISSLKTELEETERSYKNLVSTHEKKAHENWLAARGAERKLEETKREAALLRQRLTLAERDSTESANSNDLLVRPLAKKIISRNGDIDQDAGSDLTDASVELDSTKSDPFRPLHLPPDRPLPPPPPPPFAMPPPFGMPPMPPPGVPFGVPPPPPSMMMAFPPPDPWRFGHPPPHHMDFDERGRRSGSPISSHSAFSNISRNDSRQSSPPVSDRRRELFSPPRRRPSREPSPPRLPHFHDVPPPMRGPGFPPHLGPPRGPPMPGHYDNRNSPLPPMPGGMRHDPYPHLYNDTPPDAVRRGDGKLMTSSPRNESGREGNNSDKKPSTAV